MHKIIIRFLYKYSNINTFQKKNIPVSPDESYYLEILLPVVQDNISSNLEKNVL